ncbi:hypothetical protein ACFSUS_05090 [Spirosoma soli]|uniref:Uncharacterized protein n=1 Tax=Spirosoma soli TaxID=1770529 RepID=A0ABW5M1K0_9BACT
MAVNQEMLARQTHNLLASLLEMETQLAERAFFDRVQDKLTQSS